VIAFGPVPSRRLGFSLGINNILHKHCSYSCIYCQVGRTNHLEIIQQLFYSVKEILREVDIKIVEASRAGIKIDYVTFVPDGEPTLDKNLGEEIEALHTRGFPIGVISNSSLINQKEVRQALKKSDWVSLKIDSTDEQIWRKMNRPNKHLNLENILCGMLKFAKEFRGELVTESMLVSGINDNEEVVSRLAKFLFELKPFKSYISIPSRPPAESWVKTPEEKSLNNAYRILKESVQVVEMLSDESTLPFVSTGNLVDDLIGIISIHPLSEEIIIRMAEEAHESWVKILNLLVDTYQLRRVNYLGKTFYLRDYRYAHQKVS